MSEHEKFGNYILTRVIGQGAFGKVRICHRAGHPGSDFAGKLVRQGRPEGDADEKRRNVVVQREAEILTQLPRHNNIVQFVDIVVDQDSILFVFKFEQYGNLHEFLAKYIPRALSESEAAHAFRQLLNALRFLHHYKVIHRDLKPENVLVGDFSYGDTCQMTLKVTDFGLSTISESLKSRCSRVGTWYFMSPEMYSRRSDQGFQVDYWSLGIILYNLLTESYPGYDERVVAIDRQWPCLCSQEQLNAAINANVPMRLQSLVSGHLRLDPSARLDPIQAQQELDRISAPPMSIMSNLSSSSAGASGSSGGAAGARHSASGSSGGSQRRPASDSAVVQRDVRARVRATQEMVDEEVARRCHKMFQDAEETLRTQILRCDEDLAFRQQLNEYADQAAVEKLEQERIDEAIARALQE